MAKILLIETATEVCSTAIAIDGKVVAMAEELQAQQHASLLTLQIETCVRESGIPLAAIDAVAVSSGPGSYTSLRVGASVAKGICYALGKPLIAVDTLLALAHAAHDRQAATVFIPMLDARRQEVWAAAYDASLREIAPAQPLILENNLFEKFIAGLPEQFRGGPFVVAGNGSHKLESASTGENTVFSVAKNCCSGYFSALAERFFQNADFQDVAYFEPFYMKPPHITTPTRAVL